MGNFFLIAADDRIFELPEDKTIFIGRATINHISLNDRTVSRSHAAIAPSPEGPIITDRNSANGTLVNGRSIKKAVLNHGDLLQIGKFTFNVICGTMDDAKAWVHRRNATGHPHSENTIILQNVQPLRDAIMSGDLANFSLPDLLQTLADQSKNGALTLKLRNQVVGKIYYLNGNIVNAETATGMKGRDAFFALLDTRAEHFDFQAATKAPGIAIMEKPQALILEGVRRLDEKNAEEKNVL